MDLRGAAGAMASGATTARDKIILKAQIKKNITIVFHFIDIKTYLHDEKQIGSFSRTQIHLMIRYLRKLCFSMDIVPKTIAGLN